MNPRLLLVGVALLLAACQGGARSSRRAKPELQAPPEAWQGVARVAVFPPDNWTPEIGPEFSAWNRAVLGELLREKGYAVVPLVDVNRFMLKNRFTFAGELRLYTLEELGKELQADALLFWDITGSGTVNFDLMKVDGTRLWGTGEMYLDLRYNAVSREGYASGDQRWALTFGECLRKVPARP